MSLATPSTQSDLPAIKGAYWQFNNQHILEQLGIHALTIAVLFSNNGLYFLGTESVATGVLVKHVHLQ